MKKLSSERDFQWSKVRKVSYMPKKLNPLLLRISISLACLKFYTIGEKANSHTFSHHRRLPIWLYSRQGHPRAISSFQHLIQDAQQADRSIQPNSLDNEKVFDKISHAIISQALRALDFWNNSSKLRRFSCSLALPN
jgi:hypothetical protein